MPIAIPAAAVRYLDHPDAASLPLVPDPSDLVAPSTAVRHPRVATGARAVVLSDAATAVEVAVSEGRHSLRGWVPAAWLRERPRVARVA